MKERRFEALWGLILVLVGALFLAEQTGLLPDFARSTWMILLGGMSLFFFASYLLKGWREWPLLLPATVSGSLALIVGLADEGGRYGLFFGSLFMAAVSLPFWVAFAADRAQNWWAVIPGWVTGLMAVIILLTEQVAGEVIGSLVMFGIGLPFVAVYLLNRKQWWAIIPGFVLCAIGLIILFSTSAQGEWMGAFVMFVIALPFLAVYLSAPTNWWALIPGGATVTIGLVALLSTIPAAESVQARLLGGVFFGGLAATFAFVWLRHPLKETQWAKYPAVGLAFMALLIALFGPAADLLWPVALILAGLWLLYTTMVRPQLKG